MSETLKFPAGSAITFTYGEYSDFGTRGTVITLKAVDLAECAQRYARERREDPKNVDDVEGGWFSVEPVGLVAWLIVNGFAMAAAVQEIHLGNYDEFEPEFGVTEQ